MAIILPQNDIGERIGQGLGSGISTGLQTLLDNRMSELKNRNERMGFYNTAVEAGWSPQFAKFLTMVPQKDRIKAISELSSRGVVPGLEGLGQQQGPQIEAPNQTLNQLRNNDQVGIQALSGQPNVAPKSVAEAFALPKQPSTDAKARLEQDEKHFQENLKIKKAISESQLAKSEREENKAIRDFSKPYIERSEAARNDIRDYDALIKLAESGKLRAGNTHVLLDKLGLSGFNRNIETELADKLGARLAQNARTGFGPGTRLTNFLEQTFQRSLPSLWNSPDGLIKISRVNKKAAEAILEKDEVRKEIIRENKGKLPFDIEDQIEERSRPKIQKLEQQALDIISPQNYKVNSVSNTLPDASSMQNGIIRDTETGTFKKSDGKEWRDVVKIGNKWEYV